MSESKRKRESRDGVGSHMSRKIPAEVRGGCVGQQYQPSSCVLVQSIRASHFAQDTGRNTRAVCRRQLKAKRNVVKMSYCWERQGDGGSDASRAQSCSKDRMGLWAYRPHSENYQPFSNQDVDRDKPVQFSFYVTAEGPFQSFFSFSLPFIPFFTSPSFSFHPQICG